MNSDETILQERPIVQRDWTAEQVAERIRSLPIWSGAVQIEQKFGGLQNRTYFVTDADGRRHVARSGFDQGRIVTTSVVACTVGAARLGVGPAVRYAEPNLMITEFIEGAQFRAEDQRGTGNLSRIVELLKKVHSGSEALPGPVSFWAPFPTVRRYLQDLEEGFPERGISPASWAPQVPFYREITHRLERAIEPYTPVFTHNDVGYANMMYRTASRAEICLIDWDGGGYGNPMWDLGELAMWVEADEEVDRFLLARYWGATSESRMTELLHQHVALKIMAALRLMAECAQAAIDPAYYLSADEVARSMETTIGGEHRDLAGVVELLRPRFVQLWEQHRDDYA